MENGDYLHCLCNHCSGKIEFHQDHIGAEVECPLCQMTTVLYRLDPEFSPNPVEPTSEAQVNRQKLIYAMGIALSVAAVVAILVAFPIIFYSLVWVIGWGIVLSAVGGVLWFVGGNSFKAAANMAYRNVPRRRGRPLSSTAWAMIVIGLCIAFYFLLIFDVSVSGGAYSYERVVNIGRASDRQNGVIAGFGCAILGAMLLVVDRLNMLNRSKN